MQERFLKDKIGYLLENKGALSPTEVALLEQILKSSKTERDIDSLKQDEYFAIARRFKEQLAQKMTQRSIDWTISEVQKIESSTARELILCQRFSHHLDTNSDDDYFYRSIVERIHNPDYLNAISTEHDELRDQLEKTNRLLLGEMHDVVIPQNDTEKSGDQLINSILLANKNKVIFIDLWGTWCAPCRVDFAKMAPLKSSPPYDSIRFVYLCVKSQEKEWFNVIKKYNLKGTHYLITEKQYAALEKRFMISGFPTYLVIDKKRKLHTGVRVNDTKLLSDKLAELVNQP